MPVKVLQKIVSSFQEVVVLKISPKFSLDYDGEYSDNMILVVKHFKCNFAEQSSNYVSRKNDNQ